MAKYLALRQLAPGEHVDIPLRREGQRGSIAVTACRTGRMLGQKLITQTVAIGLPGTEAGHLMGSNTRFGNAVRVTRIR